MKIKQLILENFQAHRHSVFDFSDGITTIVGPTDTGKSAIVRALRWICANDLSGDAFITEGQKSTRVTLVVEEDGEIHTLRRTKGRDGSNNTYSLDGEVYKSFGTSVPDDIARLLHLGPLNFQNQHDSPFWLSQTAGEVSRSLNSIVNLSAIDESLTRVASIVRWAGDRQKVSVERLAEIRKDLEITQARARRVDDFHHLLALKKKHDELEDNTHRLESLLDEIEEYQYRKDIATEKAQSGRTLLEAYHSWRKVAVSCDRLSNLLDSLSATHSEPPPDFSQVEDSYKDAEEIDAQVSNLSSLVGRITALQEEVATKVEEARRAEEVFRQQTKGIACPLCGQPLP